MKVGKWPCDARTGRSARLCIALEGVTRILHTTYMYVVLVCYFVLAGNQRPSKYSKGPVQAKSVNRVKRKSESLHYNCKYFSSEPISVKNRKNCECCPGHYLSTSVY